MLLAGSSTIQAQNSPYYWELTGNNLSNNSSKLGHLGAYNLDLVTNGIPRMTIRKNDGKVGIGTTTPINKLTVYTQTPEDGIRVIQKGTGGLGGYGGAAALHLDNGTTGGVSWGFYSMGSGNTNEGTGNLVIASSTSGSFPATNQMQAVIIEKAAGNVGIGTLIPNITNAPLPNKLEIDVTNPEDGIRIVQKGGSPLGDGAASIHLKNNTTGGKMWSISSLGAGNTNQGSGNFLIEEADNYMQNNVDRFLIQKGTGYVGIGTSSPNDKVEINSGLPARSGLRFTQLTALTPTAVVPADFNCRKVLTVDNSGEVILMDLDSCGQASNKQASDAAQLAIQQAQIDDLKNQIAELKAIMGYQSNFSVKTASVEKPRLLQISPNPLSQKATVSYSLADDATLAYLSITDANGKVVGTFTLSKGSSEQVIDTSNFPAGIYQYSIITDGKLIDSKQMLVIH